MKRILFPTVIALSTLAAGSVLASERCTAPMAEWQPREALQQKLESDGWQVRRIKTEKGCYEAYAINKDGKRVEALFDPKTLAMLGEDKDD